MLKLKYISQIVLLMVLLTGCDAYLDKIDVSNIGEEDVFGSYRDFQGFEDQMYPLVTPYLTRSITASLNWGDDVLNNRGFPPSGAVDDGNYWYFWNNGLQNLLRKNDGNGLWQNSWKGIRIANICLKQLDDGFPKDATGEQLAQLRGQALFFRAFFHWELIRFYGGMPYIEVALDPSDDMRFPRLRYAETTQRLIQDLDEAAGLLPADWNATALGALFSGGTQGRATKGAALALKAKALLYAASPLMNNEMGNGYTFNTDLATQAAEAAAEVIQLAEQGVYRLLAWSEYSDNFYRNDGTYLWSDEVVWDAIQPSQGKSQMSVFHGRVFNAARWEGNAVMEAPTANYVELFEMDNGLPIDDPASGYDANDPWTNRDPRFYYNLLLDGTQWADGAQNPDDNIVHLYKGGRDTGNNGSLTGYMLKKYWPRGVNKYDQNWNNFRLTQPHIRLAEVYLIYAEAANEVAGPNTPVGGTSLTALEAINIVRARAGQIDVPAAYSGSAEAFRERIWNERAVELAFEGSRWFDIRRWHVAHQQEYKELYALEYDQDQTSFTKVLVKERVFEDKHYWIPIERSQTQLFEGFNQNPGW
ncbi:MAG: RagB/SusD family nutrient uptake outer membrane protein [Bacteroidota bacterium]